MKHWFKYALVVGVAALAPLAASAAIDNTHHDMTMMIANETNKCAYCHSIQATFGGAAATYGDVGAFCVIVCHSSGTTAQGENTETLPTGNYSFSGDMNGYTFNTATADPLILVGGHLMDRASMAAATRGIDDPADVIATGWPHVNDTGTTEIACTSCHAIHDNANPPFLNAPLASGTPGAGTDFCSRCHTGSAITEPQAARYGAGTHPTEIAYNVATGGETMYAAANQPTHGTAGNIMRIVATGADLDTQGNSWETGAHLMTTGVKALPTAADTGLVGCYSCHAAHNDGGTENWAMTDLILGDTLQNFCYGCHGGGPATRLGIDDIPAASGFTQENPGTTSFYHPVNQEPPTSALDFAAGLDANYTALAAGVYRPAAGSPYCVGCHDVHGGKDVGMALRDIDGTGVVSAQGFCEECHSGAASGHHPTGTTTNYTAAADGGYPAASPWGTSLADGLQCQDCHGSDNDSAHNW